MVKKSVEQLRRAVNCDDSTFNKYVYMYFPKTNSKIVVHSKVFLFDDSKLLYTTCNICDRSFYEKEDIEIGIIIENEQNVRNIKKQLQNNFADSLHLFDLIQNYEDHGVQIDAMFIYLYGLLDVNLKDQILELCGLKLKLY